MYVQNDQRVMGIILRYVFWGTHRPPLGTPAADGPTHLPPPPPSPPSRLPKVFAPSWGLEFEQAAPVGLALTTHLLPPLQTSLVQFRAPENSDNSNSTAAIHVRASAVVADYFCSGPLNCWGRSGSQRMHMSHGKVIMCICKMNSMWYHSPSTLC